MSIGYWVLYIKEDAKIPQTIPNSSFGPILPRPS